MKYLLIAILCLLCLSVTTSSAMDSADIETTFARIEEELSLIKGVSKGPWYYPKGDTVESLINRARKKAKDPNEIQKTKEAGNGSLAFYTEWLAQQYKADVIRIAIKTFLTNKDKDKGIDTKKYPLARHLICYVGFKNEKGILTVRIYCDGKRTD